MNSSSFACFRLVMTSDGLMPAQLAYSRALLAGNDKAHGDAMWKAMSLYDRAGSPQAIVGALELFVAERAADPVAPDALLRLGRTYESMAQTEKAISAYQRLQAAYAKSPAAAQALSTFGYVRRQTDGARLMALAMEPRDGRRLV